MAIFDKIVGGINKGVATVGASSKAMIEKAKINTVINNLENERKQLTQLLGTKVFEMYKSSGTLNVDDRMKNFISEIDKRLELIEQQQEHLRLIEAEVNLVTNSTRHVIQGGMSCPCGHINDDGVKFCAKCGSPQQANSIIAVDNTAQSSTAAENNTLACSCGYPNPEGMKFCVSCGSAQQHQSVQVEVPASMITYNYETSVQQNLTCPCGHVNLEGMKFCVNCGNKQ